MYLVSVIICAHNPRPDYLKRVIAALAAQSLETTHWELLLVDSGSRENLNAKVDLSWHPSGRHLREDLTGLTRARLRGIEEARGELLVFVDDDNVLDDDFLSRTTDIARCWLSLGAWSGHTRAEFEQTPAEWTRRYWGNLVIRPVERDLWSNLAVLPDTMPCGAGLSVRRSVATHYLDLHRSGQRKVALDRDGTSLLSGGDNDLAACACDIGMGVGVFASLRLTHLIPPARLREEYLLRLVEEIAFSGVILRSFRAPIDPAVVYSIKRRLANTLRGLLMNPRERRFFRRAIRGEKRALRYLAHDGTRSDANAKL